ncbi:DUF4249 domain-containing protein [Hymenobacter caeli]|uniref:DUF4249 domain-containing protein n=1 Tax=Hymenobacter caeli TaxID=2735894 RepID=A0ABX2FK56_9BACT|nr:DUF4249 domain-containing protein [Hymenobacter caeli]NRT17500.1 hypothetical protein [Hymenobacter caeli]
MKLLPFRYFAAVGALVLAGCGKFSNDLNVPLPAYDSQLVVECYLEPGVVPSLAVTESQTYLSAVAPTVPTDVTVNLSMPDGTLVPLYYKPGQDPLTQKFYTHIGRAPLVAKPGDTFGLDALDTKGRHVTGTATMPATVPIDSTAYKFNDAPNATRKAYFLTYFKDPATADDDYRLQLHKGLRIYSSPEVDLTIQDRLLNGQPVTLGTSYRFLPGDTVTATLYHLDPAFYRFRQSVTDARNANGNPFGQPSAIYSTVQGGIGVFTVLNYTRKTVFLSK